MTHIENEVPTEVATVLLLKDLSFFNEMVNKCSCKHCEKHGLPKIPGEFMFSSNEEDQLSVSQEATDLIYVNKYISFRKHGRRGGKKNKPIFVLSAAILLL